MHQLEHKVHSRVQARLSACLLSTFLCHGGLSLLQILVVLAVFDLCECVEDDLLELLELRSLLLPRVPLRYLERQRLSRARAKLAFGVLVVNVLDHS